MFNFIMLTTINLFILSLTFTNIMREECEPTWSYESTYIPTGSWNKAQAKKFHEIEVGTFEIEEFEDKHWSKR